MERAVIIMTTKFSVTETIPTYLAGVINNDDCFETAFYDDDVVGRGVVFPRKDLDAKLEKVLVNLHGFDAKCHEITNDMRKDNGTVAIPVDCSASSEYEGVYYDYDGNEFARLENGHLIMCDFFKEFVTPEILDCCTFFLLAPHDYEAFSMAVAVSSDDFTIFEESSEQGDLKKYTMNNSAYSDTRYVKERLGEMGDTLVDQERITAKIQKIPAIVADLLNKDLIVFELEKEGLIAMMELLKDSCDASLREFTEVSPSSTVSPLSSSFFRCRSLKILTTLAFTIIF